MLICSKKSCINIKSTINTLLETGVVPIINENDTVATDELKFGDNDSLAAYTATFLKADIFLWLRLPMAFMKNRVCKQRNPSRKLRLLIYRNYNPVNTVSSHGTGGMQSKLNAAKIAKEAQIETWIVNGLRENFIKDALNQTIPFTKITV